MSTKQFEDLLAWQRARELTRMVYVATQQPNFAPHQALAGQMQQAAVSVMSKIAAGYECGDAELFHQSLSTAKTSCEELRSQLYIAQDSGYLATPEFDALLKRTEQVGRLIGGLQASAQRRRNPE